MMEIYLSDSGVKRLELSVDRFSMLADVVLCHILSFLPIRDVVKTSLLSPRWKSLWKITNSLHFRYHPRYPCHVSDYQIKLWRFINFVNRVLLLHDLKSIEKFSIDVDVQLDEDSAGIWSQNLDSWVATCIARNVRNIQIHGYGLDILFKYPLCMYVSNSLETLDLSYVGTVDPPRVVSLPNVKTLRLVNVDFVCDDSVERLISGCKSLLTLHVKRKRDDNVHLFSVQSRTLEYLTIISKHHYSTLEDWLVIRTPALKYFRLDGFNLLGVVLVEVITLLHSAKINLYYSRGEPHGDSKFSGSFIQSLQNVKLLHLDASAFKAVGHSVVSIKFWHLIQLKLEIDYESTFMWDVLECMPNLENLTLKGNHNGGDDPHPFSVSKERKVPGCLTSSLKMVSVERFLGRPDQVAMLGHILENASLLQTMTVMISYMDLDDQIYFITQLSTFRRRSAMCRIEFS